MQIILKQKRRNCLKGIVFTGCCSRGKIQVEHPKTIPEWFINIFKGIHRNENLIFSN